MRDLAIGKRIRLPQKVGSNLGYRPNFFHEYTQQATAIAQNLALRSKLMTSFVAGPCECLAPHRSSRRMLMPPVADVTLELLSHLLAEAAIDYEDQGDNGLYVTGLSFNFWVNPLRPKHEFTQRGVQERIQPQVPSVLLSPQAGAIKNGLAGSCLVSHGVSHGVSHADRACPNLRFSKHI